MTALKTETIAAGIIWPVLMKEWPNLAIMARLTTRPTLNWEESSENRMAPTQAQLNFHMRAVTSCVVTSRRCPMAAQKMWDLLASGTKKLPRNSYSSQYNYNLRAQKDQMNLIPLKGQSTHCQGLISEQCWTGSGTD